jgi:hypothetical protein
MTPLRFANPSPPSDWIEDFHSKLSIMLAHNERSPGKMGWGLPVARGSDVIPNGMTVLKGI